MRENTFWAALADAAQMPFAVELDPPETAELAGFLERAEALRNGGADVVTLADCPGGRPRLDSCLTAARLHWAGIPALPHLAGRDRNALATQSLLLGLSAEDVGGVLLVTGDRIPGDEGAKGVYHFNSLRLLDFARKLNESLPRPLHLGAALNLNMRNFRIELHRAQEKEAAGAEVFFTQPLLSPEAFENLQAARETLRAHILAGIMPIVSRRNAEYMNASVPGIRVDGRIIAAYEGLDRAPAEALAESLSVALARRAAPNCDGWYLITPFTRTALMCRIMAKLRSGEETPDTLPF
ncbi:MAG: methylenetetrahydrofolate reductase [Oscillospiraceae bacterium]|nr:methylenetetrahydrofolate reductase [Oscillospiraceae bacterium]